MSGRWWRLGWRLLAALVGLALTAVVMVATGNDVVGFVQAMAKGLGANLESTLRWFPPLLLAGISGAIAFRDGALNLGLDGQIYLGGAVSAVVGLGLTGVLPAPLVVAFAVLGGAVGGAAVACLAALLRLWFGTPEVITTLVLNPLCALSVTWLAAGPLAADAGVGNTESSSLLDRSLWLPAFGLPGFSTGSIATIAVFLALGCLGVVAIYYRFTTWGYESRVFGASPAMAFFSGIPNVVVFFRAMMMSGAIAGLVGSVEVLGVQHRLAKGFNPGLGFDGIAVALVAGLSMGGLAIVALFFALLRQAGEITQITLGIPAELVDVMIALVILATSIPVVTRLARSRRGKVPT